MERQLEFSVDKIVYINIEKKEKKKVKDPQTNTFFLFSPKDP